MVRQRGRGRDKRKPFMLTQGRATVDGCKGQNGRMAIARATNGSSCSPPSPSAQPSYHFDLCSQQGRTPIRSVAVRNEINGRCSGR